MKPTILVPFDFSAAAEGALAWAAGTRIAREKERPSCRRPSQINLHQIPASPALEDHIRASVAELETFFDRIVSCRVSVNAPPRHHRQGQLFHVGIEIGVPGERIVVGGAMDEDPAHANPYVALHDAFKVARHRLEAHAGRQRAGRGGTTSRKTTAPT